MKFKSKNAEKTINKGITKDRSYIAILAFIGFVVIFTGMDYLVNATLYHFGLIFSNAWWQPYEMFYTLMFQVAILCLVLFSRSWRLLVVFEAFVLTAGEDLVYFGLWNRGVFPAGNWTWSGLYAIFGSWTTPWQAALTVTALALAIVFTTGVKR